MTVSAYQCQALQTDFREKLDGFTHLPTNIDFRKAKTI